MRKVENRTHVIYTYYYVRVPNKIRENKYTYNYLKRQEVN